MSDDKFKDFNLDDGIIYITNMFTWVVCVLWILFSLYHGLTVQILQFQAEAREALCQL
jgi:hypothetical protein